jgi:hypothetical protein
VRAGANRKPALMEVVTGWVLIFATSKRPEASGRVAIFAVRRSSAQTWPGTLHSDSGDDEIRKSRAVCIGRPVVARLGWARSACWLRSADSAR